MNHYQEAERLVDRANHYTWGDGGDPGVGAAFAAEAQVHATLALVDALRAHSVRALTFNGRGKP